MSAEAFDGFRRAVLADPVLQRELLAVEDAGRFTDAVVARARALGWDVVPADVEEATRASWQAWLARWV